MRLLFVFCACLEVAATTAPVSDLKLIDELNECVRVRFETSLESR
jgi:hypothetical protein